MAEKASKTMNKFASLVSQTGNALLQKRGQMVNDQTERVFRRALMDAQDKVDTIKSQIVDLEDLGVETTDSLKPAKGYDPNKWVKEVIQKNVELYNANIALEIIQKKYTEYFGNPENNKTEEAK